MSLSLSSEDVSQLRHAISVIASPLDAATVSEWRGQVLLALLPLFRAQAGSFVLPAEHDSTVTLVGRPASYLEKYVEHQAHDTTFERWQDIGAPSVITTDTLTDGDRRVYTGSDIYDLVYRPFAVAETVAIMLGEADQPPVLATGRRFAPPEFRAAGMLSVYGERAGQTRMSAEGYAIGSLLQPLLQSSARMLQTAATQRREIDAIIDAAPHATMLCTAAGHVAHRNRAAARLLAEEPLAEHLLEKCGHVARAVSAAALSRAEISRALGPFEQHVRGAHGAYVVRGSSISPPTGGTPHVVISLIALVVRAPSAAEVRAQHPLSKRQSEVALLLAEGRSNKEIATSLGISENTARRHTEAVFAALGVRSRAQVAARLMAALSAPPPSPS